MKQISGALRFMPPIFVRILSHSSACQIAIPYAESRGEPRYDPLRKLHNLPAAEPLQTGGAQYSFSPPLPTSSSREAKARGENKGSRRIYCANRPSRQEVARTQAPHLTLA